MYKYKFNISGGFEDMGAAMAVFVDKEANPLTYGLSFSIDSIVWGNLPAPSFDQTAEILFSSSQTLTEERLANFKHLFKKLDIAISGA